MGSMFLIIIHARTKWLDVQCTGQQATASATVDKLREVFAINGLPYTIVTDNGPCVTSLEFKTFLEDNGVTHVRTAPYHPASNGLAEKAVQTFKEGIKRQATGSLRTKVARFLLNYRTTPHTTTGTSPAELLMGRRLTTKLDRLYPDLHRRVVRQQLAQKACHDKKSVSRTLLPRQEVFVRNYTRDPPW